MKGLRCAVYTDNGLVPASSEVAAAVVAAAGSLADVGASVQEACPTGIERTYEINRHIVGGDGRSWIQRLLKRIGSTEVTPHLNRTLSLTQAIPTDEFTAWLEQMDIVRGEMLSFMEPYDVILCPVNPFPAQPHGWRSLPNTVETTESFSKGLSHTYAYNLTGWPAAVVRAGTTEDGLPIGVQIVARPWREDVALAVAQHIETVFGGWQQPSL